MNKKITCIFVSVLLSVTIMFSVGSVSADAPSVSASVSCVISGDYTGDITVNVSSDGMMVTVEFDPALGLGITPDTYTITFSDDLVDSFCVKVLVGDVDFDGVVTVDDHNLVSEHNEELTNNDNFWFDVNTNGAISSADMSSVSQREGNTAPTCSIQPEKIVAAHSIRDHDGTEYSLDLFANNNTEPRLYGVNKIEFNLSKSILPELVISVSPSTITEGDPFDVIITANDVPIKDAEVTFNGDTSLTNEEGIVSFTAPEVEEDTEYIITATKEGCTDAEPVTITVEDVPEELPQLVINVGFTITEEDVFIVTITDKNGIPVKDASVNFYGNTYTSDSNGKVTITAPIVSMDKEYLISITKAGYIGDTKSITVLNDVVEISEGWIGCTISDESVSPIPNAEIDISKGETHYIYSTDVYGVYLSSSLPVGTYTVTASKSGYKSSTNNDVSVIDGTVSVVDFTLISINGDGSDTSTDEHSGVAYALVEAQIDLGAVSGVVDAVEEEHEVKIYSENLEVNIDEVKPLSEEGGKIQVTVSGEGETGTRVAIYVPNTEDKLIVEYDGDLISEINDIKYFFSSENTEANYIKLFAESGDVVICVNIPHFSEHTITISSIIEEISAFMMAVIYIALCVIVLIAATAHMKFVWKK